MIADKKNTSNADKKMEVPNIYHPDLGEPNQVWLYHNDETKVISCICRFNPEGGKKEIRPYSLTAYDDYGEIWEWKHLPEPRPIYNLNNVTLQETKDVLIVEGEKAAEAAEVLLEGKMVVTTWSGGSNAVSKTDFSKLAHRSVYISPDNDLPGFKAALEIAEILKRYSVKKLIIVLPPDNAEEGWDLADAEEWWQGGIVDDWICERQRTPEEFRKIYEDTYLEEINPNQLTESTITILPPPPKFPIDIFPEPYRSIIIEASEAFSVPVTIPSMAFLSLSSACVGRTRQVFIKESWCPSPNLYMILVADSGIGKTPCTEAFFRALYDLDHKNYLKYQKEMLDYNRKLKENKNNKNVDCEDLIKPRLIQHYTDDATIESISQILSENTPGILWKQDEIIGLLKGMGRYNAKSDDNCVKSRLNSAHSCGPWKVSRKTSETISIPHACLSIYGTIQPGMIPELFSDLDGISGFMPRFLMARVEADSPQFYSEQDFNREKTQALDELVNYLAGLKFDDSEKPIQVHFDSEAKNIFVDWQNNIVKDLFESDYNAVTKAFMMKLKDQCARFCLILHLLEECSLKVDQSIRIGEKTVSNAITLAEWFLDNHRQFIQILSPDVEVRQATMIEKQVMKALIQLDERGFVTNGLLSTELIADNVNHGVDNQYEIKKETVGRVCSQLGLGGTKMPDGKKRGYIVNPDDVENFRRIFKYPSKVSKVSQT